MDSNASLSRDGLARVPDAKVIDVFGFLTEDF